MRAMKHALHTHALALVITSALLLQGCATSVPLDAQPVKKEPGTAVKTESADPAEGQQTRTGRADGTSDATSVPSHTVYFEFDSAEIRATSLGDIEALARYYRNHRTGAAIVLEGHADERGSREYNLALGQKRAEAVLKALVVLGVTPARAEAISFGEEKPAVAGSTEEAWAKNRRVELIAR
jgi:peptidoglycan-associated lipoprotein